MPPIAGALATSGEEQNMQLKGKVAVVAGASGKGGSGWDAAETLAREGCKVVVSARRKDRLEELAKSIGGTAIACDMTKPEEIANLAKQTLKTYGKIDIAVNASGAAGLG